MKKIAGIILIILAVLMLYIGIFYRMLPPALTAIGFTAIALVFLLEKKAQ
jgi:Na+-transporting methylmalonyl-CoA/oxaloacetate decarboxylase beta subunit